MIPRPKFIKQYSISKDKVLADAEKGLLDIVKIRKGNRDLWYVLNNEKLKDYDPNTRKEQTIAVKNSPAWIYRYDIMGQECCRPLETNNCGY